MGLRVGWMEVGTLQDFWDVEDDDDNEELKDV